MEEGKDIHGLLPRAKTEPEFLELSLRGLGLFVLFWLGGSKGMTGSIISGSSAWDLASEVWAILG